MAAGAESSAVSLDCRRCLNLMFWRDTSVLCCVRSSLHFMLFVPAGRSSAKGQRGMNCAADQSNRKWMEDGGGKGGLGGGRGRARKGRGKRSHKH